MLSIEETQRNRIVKLASWAVGAGASNRRDDFVSILGPTAGNWDLDRPFGIRKKENSVAYQKAPRKAQLQTQGVSTCGLVAEGLWRLAGVAVPEDWAPYAPKRAIQYAIARADMFARACGARQLPGMDLRPKPGDYLCIGSGIWTHVCTVVDWEDDICITVDGGQVDTHGLQCVKRWRRHWEAGKQPFLNDRVVDWWVDVERLPWGILAEEQELT